MPDLPRAAGPPHRSCPLRQAPAPLVSDLELHGDDADFDDWLAGQRPHPGYGGCRVLVCPETANSPLGLCARHESRYQSQGRPGGAALPSQWVNRHERRGLAVLVTFADEKARAELQWGLFAYTQPNASA